MPRRRRIGAALFAVTLVLLVLTASCGSGQGGLVNLSRYSARTDDSWPSWSPDGSKIVFLFLTYDTPPEGEMPTATDCGIYVMNADGSNRTKMLTFTSGIGGRSPSWSPDGDRIVVAVGGILTLDSNGGNLKRVVAGSIYGIWDWPSYSPDGSKILFAASRPNKGWLIFTVNTDGSNETCLSPESPDEVQDCSPAWSPDGTKIAFDSDRDGHHQVYLMNTDGSNLTRLTGDTVANYSPTWSPDGTRIAFVSDRDGQSDIYIMSADGSSVTRLTNNKITECDPRWSPDGRRILFWDGNAHDIYVVDVPA